ncbi:GNAT family N-acetyltransferase [Amycolatopsis samaneae]|uniref:GNAT family N-acetyltransferase n=1 Tax=Amycolatopsis samaneae TaxID=664691 RepID=A0ABW5G8C1_9PSEU
MTTVHGDLVCLRPLTTADRSRVREILATPEVSRWWGDPDRETDSLLADHDGDEEVTVSAIEFDGGTVGVVQSALGFRPVGVLRQYERGADGTWHDGLLMDLLADELTGTG